MDSPHIVLIRVKKGARPPLLGDEDFVEVTESTSGSLMKGVVGERALARLIVQIGCDSSKPVHVSGWI